MKILARGSNNQTKELREKLMNVSCELDIISDLQLDQAKLKEYDLIFDLNFDDRNNALEDYINLIDIPVIVGAAKQQLAKAVFDAKQPISCLLIGMNTLPTFINRSILELSLLDPSHKEKLSTLMASLGLAYQLVQDRVGMVTPRVVLMIINEACYTLQEGTASMQDIDTSMKLGTNYPKGPFEWADLIGVKAVYETLLAIYEDTHDERYKICSLLKTHALLNKPFYQ